MNNNQLTIVKEYNFDNPLIQNINSIISECYRDCHHKYFHTFDFICEYNLNFTISKQINKLTIKIYSNLSHINIHYHLRLGASPLHRQFFKILSRNRDYIQTHCNNRRNPFHFACRQWYSYNNPHIML